MTVAKILKAALEKGRFASQAELADYLETSQGNISRYMRGQEPGGPILLRIMALAKELGLEDGFAEIGQDSLGPLKAQGFSLIPRYDISAGAGNGKAALVAQPAEHLAFKTDWLRSLGVSTEKAALLTADGDSMEPTIPDGAVMLVDTSEGAPLKNGCLYVFLLDGDNVVKRVARRADGSVDLISDNSAYPVDTIPQKHLDRLTVAGRVVWIGRAV